MNFIPTGNIDKWFADNGDTTLRIDYPLTKDSLVLDVGGYRGDWSQKIADKYNPYIYIFEPIPQFCYLIMERFKQNPKVLVFNFGLSNTTRPANISVNNDSSSIYLLSDNQIRIILIDIDQFLRNFKSHEINLIKINIEGAEYLLLKRMLEQDIVSRCQDIQIQFHSFYPNAVRLRNEIREALQETHSLTYDYPFVWENWTRNAS